MELNVNDYQIEFECLETSILIAKYKKTYDFLDNFLPELVITNHKVCNYFDFRKNENQIIRYSIPDNSVWINSSHKCTHIDNLSDETIEKLYRHFFKKYFSHIIPSNINYLISFYIPLPNFL